MKPDNLQSVVIKNIADLVTNIEEQDLSENFALELDGFRNTKGQTVGQRDFGSRHLYALPPLRPNTVYRISGISYAGTTATLAMTDAVPAGLVGTQVTIWVDENLTGGAYSIYNGVWLATVVSTTSLTISMPAGQGSISGGIVSLSPVTIVNGSAIYDSDRSRTFDIVVATDQTGSYRIYVYDQDPATNLYRWIDLTAVYAATLSAVSLGGNNSDKILLTGVTYGGQAFTLPNSGDLSSWVGYYVYNQTRHSIGVIAMGQSGVSFNCIVTRSYSFSPWQAGDSVLISPSRDLAVLGVSLLLAAPTSLLPLDTQKKVEIYSGSRVVRVQYRDKQVYGGAQIDTTYTNIPAGLAAVVGAAGGLTGTFYYRVMAVTASGTSYPCASASVALSSQQANLTWNAVTGATSYVIHRAIQVTDTLAPVDANCFKVDVFTSATNSYTDNTAPGTGTQVCFEQSHVALAPTPATLVSSVIPQQAGWYIEYSTIAPACIDWGLQSFHDPSEGNDTNGGGC